MIVNNNTQAIFMYLRVSKQTYFHLPFLGIPLKEHSTRRKKDVLLHHALRVQDSTQKSMQKHHNSHKSQMTTSKLGLPYTYGLRDTVIVHTAPVQVQMTTSKLGLPYTYGLRDTVTVHTAPVQVQSRQNSRNEKRKWTQNPIPSPRHYL